MLKKRKNLFLEQFWKKITLFYIMITVSKVRMPTIRPLDTKVGGAGAIPAKCIPNTSISFEDIAMVRVERAEISAANILYTATVTQHCNQKRRFSIHCNFVIT